MMNIIQCHVRSISNEHNLKCIYKSKSNWSPKNYLLTMLYLLARKLCQWRPEQPSTNPPRNGGHVFGCVVKHGQPNMNKIVTKPLVYHRVVGFFNNPDMVSRWRTMPAPSCSQVHNSAEVQVRVQQAGRGEAGSSSAPVVFLSAREEILLETTFLVFWMTSGHQTYQISHIYIYICIHIYIYIYISHIKRGWLGNL